MRNNEIKLTLFQKMVELKKILPDELKDDLINNVFVSGGCFWSMIHDKKINDYDFFVKNKEYKDKLVEFFEGNKDAYITDNAITIGDIQIILLYNTNPMDTVINFDFCHCMCFYDFSDGVLYLNNWVFRKDIAVPNFKCPVKVSMFFRIPKMIEKGFHIRREDIAEMLKRLKRDGFSDEDDKTIEKLGTYEEQKKENNKGIFIDWANELRPFKFLKDEKIFDRNLFYIFAPADQAVRAVEENKVMKIEDKDEDEDWEF